MFRERAWFRWLVLVAVVHFVLVVVRTILSAVVEVFVAFTLPDEAVTRVVGMVKFASAKMDVAWSRAGEHLLDGCGSLFERTAGQSGEFFGAQHLVLQRHGVLRVDLFAFADDGIPVFTGVGVSRSGSNARLQFLHGGRDSGMADDGGCNGRPSGTSVPIGALHGCCCGRRGPARLARNGELRGGCTSVVVGGGHAAFILVGIVDVVLGQSLDVGEDAVEPCRGFLVSVELGGWCSDAIIE